MKHLFSLCLGFIFLLFACGCGCEKRQSELSSVISQTEQSSLLEEPSPILQTWLNDDWTQEQTLMFCWDIDGDNEEEEFTYEMDEQNWRVVITVGEQKCILDYVYVSNAVLADFDRDDGAYDLFICGDVASSDYVVAQMRCRADSIEIIQNIEGLLQLKGDEFWMQEVIQAIGTWIGCRQYAVDAKGWLSPLTDTLSVNEDADAQSEDRLEGYPYLLKDLEVSLHGESYTVPAGTRLYPVCYAADLSYVELQIVGGERVRLILPLEQIDGRVYVDNEWEQEYFGNLRYAG